MKVFIDFWQEAVTKLLAIIDASSEVSSLLEITDWDAVESSLPLQLITSGTISFGFEG
jgi:uncharacterized protein Usg